jgi:hypothetical protein
MRAAGSLFAAVGKGVAMGMLTCSHCGHITTLALTLPERNHIEITGAGDGTTDGCAGRFKDRHTMIVEPGCIYDRVSGYTRMVIDGLIETQPFAARLQEKTQPTVVRGEVDAPRTRGRAKR